MQKDLIGAYVEITSLECEAGYFKSQKINCFYIDNSGVAHYKKNCDISMGYNAGEPTSNIIWCNGTRVNIGYKFIFLTGYGVVDEKFVNWILTHSKPVLYNNKISRLQYNGKYVRNVNDKSVSKVDNKEILPYCFTPNYSYIKLKYIGEEPKTMKIPLRIAVLEPTVEFFLNNQLVATFDSVVQEPMDPKEVPSIEVSFVKDQEYEFKIVGGCFDWYRFFECFVAVDAELVECINGKNSFFTVESAFFSSIGNTCAGDWSNSFVKFLNGCIPQDFTNNSFPGVKIISCIGYPANVRIVYPRTMICLILDNNQHQFSREIQFNHLENDTLFFEITKYKKAKAITIYHYGNPTVLNYDWAAKNYTPTFVDLRETTN